LQPFVENAVIHGLSPLKNEGHLQISISKNEEKILCSIMDNGVGRYFKKTVSNHKSFHKSYGIKITKERLQLFSSKSVKKNNVEFTDLKDDEGNAKGTLVTVIMPYKKTLTHP
jgi:sensor histidine kinase YesM